MTCVLLLVLTFVPFIVLAVGDFMPLRVLEWAARGRGFRWTLTLLAAGLTGMSLGILGGCFS